MLYRLKVM